MKRPIIMTLVIALMLGCHSDEWQQGNTQGKKITINTAAYSLRSIDDLHERLTLKNYDQDLAEYINSSPNKVDSLRKVVYLLPFGNMKPEVEKIIQDEVQYLEAFLQLEVKVLDRIPYDRIKALTSIQTRLVPESDFDHYSKMKGEIPNLREQIQASSFIEAVMKKNKPKDAIAVLGITEHDIYNPEYNYLFGISQLKDGVGLVSTFRLIDYGQTTRDNMRKVVSKQIVNMFSITNVKDFKCLTNFHIDRGALHRGTFDLSPRALEKLKYAIGFDYTKRFDDLAKFWAKENHQEEVKYYAECLRRAKLHP